MSNAGENENLAWKNKPWKPNKRETTKKLSHPRCRGDFIVYDIYGFVEVTVKQADLDCKIVQVVLLYWLLYARPWYLSQLFNLFFLVMFTTLRCRFVRPRAWPLRLQRLLCLSYPWYPSSVSLIRKTAKDAQTWQHTLLHLVWQAWY